MIDGWGGGGAGDRRTEECRRIRTCCVLFSYAAHCFRVLDVQGVPPELELPELTSRRVVDPDRD